MKLSKSILFSIAFALAAIPVRAEDSEPERGRLPDGRAFRTDAQGNQLVDYIAELELSIEQLTRRVHGLEFEAEEKQNQINRLSKAGVQGHDVEERDLLSGRSPAPQADRFAAPERMACPQPVDCSAQVASTQQMLEKARFDLDVARRVQDKNRAEYETNIEQMRVEYGKQACPRVDCTMEVAQASAAGTRYQQELVQTQAAATAEREAQQRRIQDYEGSVVRLKSELSSRDEQIRALQTKLAMTTSTEAKTGAVVAVSQQQRTTASLDDVASTRENGTDSEQVASSRAVQPRLFNAPTEERASFSAAKTRAVDSLRGSMTGDIRRLRDLVSTRDSLFQGYNQSGRALSFKSSPLVSSRGYTLSWVTERVKSASNIYELSSLSRDIREIRTRVQDDIDLIKRMQRQNG